MEEYENEFVGVDASIAIDDNIVTTDNNHVRLWLITSRHWWYSEIIREYKITITSRHWLNIPNDGTLSIRFQDGKEHRQKFVKLQEHKFLGEYLYDIAGNDRPEKQVWE